MLTDTPLATRLAELSPAERARIEGILELTLARELDRTSGNGEARPPRTRLPLDGMARLREVASLDDAAFARLTNRLVALRQIIRSAGGPSPLLGLPDAEAIDVEEIASLDEPSFTRLTSRLTTLLHIMPDGGVPPIRMPAPQVEHPPARAEETMAPLPTPEEAKVKSPALSRRRRRPAV